MKVKIRKGDLVEVISGSEEDKGKRGEVIRVDPDENRIVIQRVNISAIGSITLIQPPPPGLPG